MTLVRCGFRPPVRTEKYDGYLIFNGHEVVEGGLGQLDMWSSRSVDPNEHNPSYKWIPTMLDPTRAPEMALRTRHPHPAWAGQEYYRRSSTVWLPSSSKDCLPNANMTSSASSPDLLLQIKDMPQDNSGDFVRWVHMVVHLTAKSNVERNHDAGIEALPYTMSEGAA